MWLLEKEFRLYKNIVVYVCHEKFSYQALWLIELDNKGHTGYFNYSLLIGCFLTGYLYVGIMRKESE